MDGALLAALFLLALVLRLVPLLFSPLPYNVDGFALTKIASDFGATGHWSLNASDPNAADLKLPAFSLFWHAVVGLGGQLDHDAHAVIRAARNLEHVRASLCGVI